MCLQTDPGKGAEAGGKPLGAGVVVQDSGHSKPTPPVGTDRGPPWPGASSEGPGSLGFWEDRVGALLSPVCFPVLSSDSSQDHGRLSGTMGRISQEAGAPCGPRTGEVRGAQHGSSISLQGLGASGAALTHHYQRPTTPA